jgi:hypothetical protein
MAEEKGNTRAWTEWQQAGLFSEFSKLSPFLITFLSLNNISHNGYQVNIPLKKKATNDIFKIKLK